MDSYSGMGICYSSLSVVSCAILPFVLCTAVDASGGWIHGGQSTAAQQGRESLFGGSALAGQVADEMKDVRISCIFTNKCTLSPLLTTEQQSDAMICPNNVRSICATKKRMIA